MGCEYYYYSLKSLKAFDVKLQPMDVRKRR